MTRRTRLQLHDTLPSGDSRYARVLFAAPQAGMRRCSPGEGESLSDNKRLEEAAAPLDSGLLSFVLLLRFLGQPQAQLGNWVRVGSSHDGEAGYYERAWASLPLVLCGTAVPRTCGALLNKLASLLLPAGIAIVLTIAGAIHVGSAVGQTPNTRIANVVEPRTYDQLLRNFKTAIVSGLLVKRDFYIETTLTTFFGKGRMRWLENDVERARGDWLVEIEGRPRTGALNLVNDISVYFFRRPAEASGKVRADVRIEFQTGSPNRPNFSEVEAIFGGGGVLHDNLIPRLPIGTPRATAPHGNDLVTYDAYQGHSDVVLRVEFSHDGRIQRTSVGVTR